MQRSKNAWVGVTWAFPIKTCSMMCARNPTEGVVVHPIDASRIYVWNGSVRCLVNVLRRAGL